MRLLALGEMAALYHAVCHRYGLATRSLDLDRRLPPPGPAQLDLFGG